MFMCEIARAKARSLTTNRLRDRHRLIVSLLSDMSKDGWRHALPCDYEPLEKELREIEEKLKTRAMVNNGKR